MGEVERHMWQAQTEHQAARLANDKSAIAEAQSDYAKLRRQALFQAAGPGCLPWCWRFLSLPRSL